MGTNDRTSETSKTPEAQTGTATAPSSPAATASGEGPGRLPLYGTATAGAPAPPATSAPASSPEGAGDATGAAAPSGEAPAPGDLLMGQVIETLRTVYDPEIPVNIYELGMIYDVKIEAPATVLVKMTLTSPSCPVAGSLPGDVQLKVQNIPGVASAKVDLVWEPPWNPSLMSDAAKLELGMF